jgi:hypothetical protein
MDAGAGNTWRPSKCSERDLLWLVAEGLLQEKDVVQWRPAGKDEIPFEKTGETILFAHLVERGLALPPLDFFRGLLHFYKLKVLHLNPNLILHISIFVHLCKAFQGIRPNFKLFYYLFCLKPQPNYLGYSTSTSLSGWHAMWFYIGSHKPWLPEKENIPPSTRALGRGPPGGRPLRHPRADG